jgi:epoxide hydrolase
MGSTRRSRREFLTSIPSALALSSTSALAQSISGETMIPFSFRASNDALTDLRRRLDQTRLPEQETGVGWEQGPPLAALRNLVDYWRSGYDWRKCQRLPEGFAGCEELGAASLSPAFLLARTRSRRSLCFA